MPAYRMDNGKWRLETHYERGERHSAKGLPYKDLQVQLGHLSIEEELEYASGYKRGKEQRLTNLLRK